MTDIDPITALLALVALLAAVGAPLMWACLVLDRQANAAETEMHRED